MVLTWDSIAGPPAAGMERAATIGAGAARTWLQATGMIQERHGTPAQPDQPPKNKSIFHTSGSETGILVDFSSAG
jgi:hypothetical protein